MSSVCLLVRKIGGRWVGIREDEVATLSPADWHESIVLPGAHDLVHVMSGMIDARTQPVLTLAESRSVVRRSPFVFDGETFHLPPPTSAGAGQARHQWFKRWSGDRGVVRIASAARWATLEPVHGRQVLLEYADGTLGVG